MDEHEIFTGLEDVKLTLFDSTEWREICNRENSIGPEALLEEILDKRVWSNVEILWVVKRMLFYYGSKDSVLKKAPPERLLLNMAAVLRVLYMFVDYTNPELDDNIRSYISSKLTDATWGINQRTRQYLRKRD
ncbi:MAG TPA: hypothetical protein GXX39_06640 [Syntrophothermus lipocalidus]|uniref:Uncharacterized protein n=1 Tax=Syntrophothermus lipocalidus (strain DSM 12680 / TGB-C1) TaxID=643648 RepID=D7CLP3_SYNLT|nr:hypothetical protein [Syntrophothermus lipocalidus]ADI01628.1 conserved hypothetical protein [Syntrophothermus lipocalidus DSM 12680]HHV77025.1 hypothetical protein [Syntrophothermus lipocalidus]HOV43145.1 hypothetical protein [Syntrophothermus lipocalidus]